MKIIKFPVLSPCKKTCKLVSDKCASCDRTIDEIIKWQWMTDFEKIKVITRIKNEI
jgi:predicted Fe-S protein YdhL (DUF1289 family)